MGIMNQLSALFDPRRSGFSRRTRSVRGFRTLAPRVGIRLATALLFVLFFAAPLSASGGSDSRSYTEQSYKNAVSRNLGHRLDENEEVVAAATWLWYDQKCGHEWEKEGFSMAVEAGAKNCANEAMITAAKTGKFGEKLLKALVVAAGDAAENFSEWVEKNSDRYGEKK